MTRYEIDWRIEPLHAVIVGIDAGLAGIGARIDKELGFDGLTASEHAEPLLGLGFVAAQTYVLGTAQDLNAIRRSRGKSALDKSECYKCDAITLKETVTRIELINAVANYFKHHDEWWRGWPDRQDTQILSQVGITQET